MVTADASGVYFKWTQNVLRLTGGGGSTSQAIHRKPFSVGGRYKVWNWVSKKKELARRRESREGGWS